MADESSTAAAATAAEEPSTGIVGKEDVAEKSLEEKSPDAAAPTDTTADAEEKPAEAAPTTEANTPPAPPAPPAVVYRHGEYGAVCGFDIGTLKTVCAISKRSDPQSIGLVRNADMMSSTPSVISFPNAGHGTRKFGAHAEQDRRNNASNTVDRLGWVGMTLVDQNRERESGRGLFANSTFKRADEGVVLEVDGTQRHLTSEQIVAMFLLPLKNNANLEAGKPVECVFALPACAGAEQQQCLRNAAKLSGFASSRVVPTSAALASLYTLQRFDFLQTHLQKGPSTVLIIDHGEVQFSVSVVQLRQAENEGVGVQVVSSVCVKDEAGLAMVEALFDHFSKQCAEKYGTNVTRTSRLGQRLLKSCRKAKETLSKQIRQTGFVLDAIGGGKDGRFSLTFAELSTLCKPQQAALDQAIKQALAEAEVDGVDTVELTGGGSRSELVRTVVINHLGAETKLCYTLDMSFALARGTALWGAVTNNWHRDPSIENTKNLSIADTLKAEDVVITKEEVEKFTQIDTDFAKADAEYVRQNKLIHELQEYVYHIKDSCSSSAYAETLDEEALSPLLDAAEEFCYDQMDVPGGGEKCAEKLVELRKQVATLCPKYLAKLEEERIAQQKKQEADQAAALAAKAAAAAEDGDDHDRRKIRFAKRLEKALKNKKEANELFGGKNFAKAIARYVKALGHTDLEKIAGTLSDEEAKERDSLRLSLYLNLAMCWLKEKQPKRALDNCIRALEIDATSIKALYRKATSHLDLKQYDKAKKECSKALKQSPDDKSLNKLQKKIQKQLDKQKAKSRKMAKKMFR